MSCESLIEVHQVEKTYYSYANPLRGLCARISGRRLFRGHEFTALKDIDFKIDRGETVGIIGRNGSGKSTLLQIICGILKPTNGSVVTRGRISALLELGSGFQPEFTGRENVFLQGAILGFSHEEMRMRLGAIEAFADIGDFLDQPVKHYSSGMFVRLAFSVAIATSPDILVVDEALAVGDAAFQIKCFRRIREMRENGCTVLFVTHSVEQVLRLCPRAILLDKGRMLIDDAARVSIDAYRAITFNSLESRLLPSDRPTRIASPHAQNPDCFEFGNRKGEIVRASITDENQRETLTLHANSPFTISYRVRFHSAVAHPVFGFTIRDEYSMEIAGTNSFFHAIETGLYSAGESVDVGFVQKLPLRAGHYWLSLNCTGFEDNQMIAYHRAHDFFALEIVSQRSNLGLLDPFSEISLSRA
ncbi:MAG: ABC transporter ATP-binding protein [Candidatus Accumulibacter meliphilus]|jgi:teichoic acid transport system ATP-binding protein|uniref:ABC transporter ATP-binding protein n=1 Tax=Candidatus Accumulibacter meliphilus TaxID=2211374 RepID=A0A369XRN6_9PROT|nr:MAG: ABC transporter ATP-binding protein [Candidatus Accumulibacter meliphilus]